MKLWLARLDDAQFLHALRNDPLTRANSRTTQEISTDEHLRWLAATLADRNRRLYIAEHEGVMIGTGRLDYSPEHAELSLTVAPMVRGKGYARQIIAALVDLSESVRPLVAEVSTDNLPCLFAFMREGFRVQHLRANAGRVWLFMERTQ